MSLINTRNNNPILLTLRSDPLLMVTITSIVSALLEGSKNRWVSQIQVPLFKSLHPKKMPFSGAGNINRGVTDIAAGPPKCPLEGVESCG